MIAAADQTGMKEVVNHVRTPDPYYRRVRWLIESGAVGRVRSVMVRWHEGMSPVAPTCSISCDSCSGRKRAGSSAISTRAMDSSIRRKCVIGFADDVEVFLDNRVGHAAPRELDIAGDVGRIRIGDTLFPELFTKDDRGSFGELLRRPFPGSVIGASPMTVAVDELLHAIETGAKPGSDLRDGRANLEPAVAFHLSSRRGDRSISRSRRAHDLVC